jgi:hypothetical protein
METAVLKRLNVAMADADASAGGRKKATFPGALDNLSLLTAYRRLRGEADPLSIEVSGGETFECVFPELPSFHVAFKNVDRERSLIGFQRGGNYRSGRRCPIWDYSFEG